MKTTFSTLILTASLILGLCLSVCASDYAMADNTHKIGEAFQIKGDITNYYGREKTAEAIMWENALKVCNDLGTDTQGLLLNRVSDVVLETAHARSTATASFVCVYVGLGG